MSIFKSLKTLSLVVEKEGLLTGKNTFVQSPTFVEFAEEFKSNAYYEKLVFRKGTAKSELFNASWCRSRFLVAKWISVEYLLSLMMSLLLNQSLQIKILP